MIAYTDAETGDYDSSLQTFQESLKISEEMGDIEALSQTSLLMAKTYQRMGKHSQAVDTAKTRSLLRKRFRKTN